MAGARPMPSGDSAGARQRSSATAAAAAGHPSPASPWPHAGAPPQRPRAAADRSRRSAAALRELSPWSMFLSADVLVKAVMIGLAFRLAA